MNDRHRGTKNRRNSRNVHHNQSNVQKPTSRHALVSRAYAAWRRSDDERVSSVGFNEFSQQRPDVNVLYEPAAWVRWYQRNVNALRAVQPVLVPADETEAHESLVGIGIIADAEIEHSLVIEPVVDAPVKKQRKPRAKKSDEIVA